MTPEERAKSVLHFLDEYLAALAEVYRAPEPGQAYRIKQAEKARQYLGTALVALVTDAQETKPIAPGREYVAGPYASQRKVDE